MAKAKRPDQKRHYLPAAAIGYFSPEPNLLKRRESMVYIFRKDNGLIRYDKAKNVGYSKHIYGYGKGPVHDHDGYFKGGEVMITEPVERLVMTTGDWFNADDWVKLAWYISTQINRGPDLEAELSKIITDKGWPAENVAVGYPLNGQRTSSAVLRARWQFVRTSNHEFVLGDRGITGFSHGEWKSYAYFVPLRKDFGVLLGPAPFRKQIKWLDGKWQINIDAMICKDDMTDLLNKYTFHAARQELYGSHEDTLTQIAECAKQMPAKLAEIATKYEGAQFLGLTVSERMKDELLLLSLLGGIRAPEPGEDYELTV